MNSSPCDRFLPSGDLMHNVESLLRAHTSGLLGGSQMPEDAVVGVIPDDKLLDVLSLSMCLNYQRNSYGLWTAVRSSWNDESTRWVFDPSAVAVADESLLREALTKHKVALQPNKHVATWQRVARTIAGSFGGSFAGLIEAGGESVASTRNIVQVDRKSEFPYFSGPKIFNYWAYVVGDYCSVAWSDRSEISIAPDTHILQASVHLGICSEDVLDGTQASRLLVAAAWRSALDGSGISPIDVHTPLWLWSRLGFPQVVSAAAGAEVLERPAGQVRLF
jgi:hypothetical protein